MSDNTAEAQINAKLIKLPENPHPLLYKYACIKQVNWIDYTQSDCGNFIHPQIFDANNCIIPQQPNKPGIAEAIAITLSLTVTSLTVMAVILL